MICPRCEFVMGHIKTNFQQGRGEVGHGSRFFVDKVPRKFNRYKTNHIVGSLFRCLNSYCEHSVVTPHIYKIEKRERRA